MSPEPRSRDVSYYPVFLDLSGRRCVVVGDNDMAAEKVRALAQAGASVTVLSAAPCAALQALAGGPVDLLRRPYQTGDLAGARLAIDTSGDVETGRLLREEATAAGVLLNVADRPAECDFISPAVVRRGPLQLAISTSGESPFVAAALRRQLEALLGAEWADFVSLVGQVRRGLRRRQVSASDQQRVYRRLLTSGILDLLRRGETEQAKFQAAAVSAASARARRGRVALVGAGPGDPSLLTLAAVRLIAQADVVFHDALIAPETLALCNPRARQVNAGKRAGRSNPGQESITRHMIAAARAGLDVVRLKGGDPFLFGRGGEELRDLTAAGIETIVVPGVSSALAAPAAAGIPATMRGIAQSVAVITGQAEQSALAPRGLEALAAAADTLVVLMPLANLRAIAKRLCKVLPTDRPAAVISRGTLADQQVVRGPLNRIYQVAKEAGIQSPALLVVGPVTEALTQAQEGSGAASA